MAKKKKTPDAAAAVVETTPRCGVVLYTDGGARPNPGPCGWGFHGYHFDLNNTQYTTRLANKELAPEREGVVTDKGYSTLSKQEGGRGTQVLATTYVDSWGALGVASNNAAEVHAALNAINYTCKVDHVESLTVYTDSKYVVEGMREWSKKWIAADFKRDGEPMPNADAWRQLLASTSTLESSGTKVTWNWVKGHATSVGNKLADRNATRAVILSQKDRAGEVHEEVSPPAGYWAPKAEYNRLFSLNRWYFVMNTDVAKSTDGRHVYHLGQSTADNEYDGKRMSDQAYAVVYLKEPEPVLEQLREYQTKISRTTQLDVVKVYLANVFTASVYQDLKDHQMDYVVKADHFNDLYTIDQKQLTWHARPPRKVFDAISNLAHLQGVLDTFLSKESIQDPYTVYTDVTSYFYEHEEKKGKSVCVLRKTIAQTLKSLTLPVGYDLGAGKKEANVILTLGLDTPSRNALSALTAESPTLTLVTRRESSVGFRYYLVLSAGEDVGIYASMVSNLYVERS